MSFEPRMKNLHSKKIECELAEKGYLDRLSLSVDEKKICFEFQKGFKRKVPGREFCTLQISIRRGESDFQFRNRLPMRRKKSPLGLPVPVWTRDQVGYRSPYGS